MWLVFQHQSDATVGTQTFLSEHLRLLLATDHRAEFVSLRTATPLSEENQRFGHDHLRRLHVRN